MPNVYILSPREGLDFSKATQFGTPVRVAQGVNPADFEDLCSVAREIVSSLKEGDMIMPTATLASGVIMAYLIRELGTTDIFGGKLDILIFNAKLEVYRTRTISL